MQMPLAIDDGERLLAMVFDQPFYGFASSRELAKVSLTVLPSISAHRLVMWRLGHAQGISQGKLVSLFPVGLFPSRGQQTSVESTCCFNPAHMISIELVFHLMMASNVPSCTQIPYGLHLIPLWFPYCFPIVFLLCSYGFPMEPPWCPYGFPIGSLLFSHWSPVVSLWCSYGFPMVSL